jgi:L-aspartate oxidase
VTSFDYVIVGSGIAGLYAALLAREHGSVLILTKGSIDEANTKYAQGGIAAAVGDDDSAELHLEDTLDAGAGLVDPEAARILTTEAADRISDLVRFGVPFDSVDGEIALGREAAHSRNRIIHAGGDSTGAHIELTLAGLARESNVTILEHSQAVDLLVEDGMATGIVALDARTRRTQEFEARYLILATGGSGQLFRATTNPPVATGDGVALAYRAGAEVMDMEFYQFHPTALRLPGVPVFLISEAVRGEGALLLNEAGERFMTAVDERAELAPRDIVARAIVSEMARTDTDRVYLDVTHLAH